jgi:ABC-2 type transport system ATP-binding protein
VGDSPRALLRVESDAVPAATEPIIRTVGLTKTYPGGIEAVKGVDLEILPGEIYGLLGPNGAGKTTTIGMLTTRVVPTSGQAWVGGVDMIHHSSLAKQVIGVVPQTNTLDRAMSVADNLVFHGRYFGMRAREAKAAAATLLDKVRLTDRADAPVAALSGGMAQRLMVARAILHKPQVLFLDEPTAGLDPQSRIALWEIIRELHGEGQTVMLTTHYMEEADLLADRVAIMDHGSILALDTPDALKRSIGADSIVRVSADGDLQLLADALCAGVAGATRATVVDGAVVLHASGPALLPRVIASADQAGFTATDLSVSEPSLETVFISLTGKDLRE